MSRISTSISTMLRQLYNPLAINPTNILSKSLQQQYSPNNVLPTTFVRGMARKAKAPTKDPRITMIHYALYHPLTPRPLKFGRLRALRHWTIHRAWEIYKHKLKALRERELERQWIKMQQACDELKRVDEKLFRIATSTKGVGEFPLELRFPTDTPSRKGWNEGWKREG